MGGNGRVNRNKCILFWVAILFLAALAGCQSAQQSGAGNTASSTIKAEDEPMTDIVLVIDGATFTATLENNHTAQAFLHMLPLTLTMSDLHGNEKYSALAESLPVNAQNVGTIHEGDIMLYGSDCLVVFYSAFETDYSYTPIGRLDDAAGLAGHVGGSEVEVTIQAGP